MSSLPVRMGIWFLINDPGLVALSHSRLLRHGPDPKPGERDGNLVGLTILGLAYTGIRTAILLASYVDSKKRKVTLKFRYGDAGKNSCESR